MNFEQYVLATPYRDWLIDGVFNSTILILLSITFSLLGGGVLFLLLQSRFRFLQVLSTSCTIFFRNTPPVPLLLFLLFGLPGLYTKFTGDPFPSGLEYFLLLFTISANGAAYIREILRSGYRSISIEVIESAQLLGFSQWHLFTEILFPLIIQKTLPALNQRIVHIMKNSSIALVVPLYLNKMEIMGQAGRIAGQTFAWVEPLVIAALMYWVFTLLISFSFKLVSMGVQR